MNDEPLTNIDQETHPVILFDGVCNLCSGAVQFVIKRDPKDIFRFASLQSDYGEKVLHDFQLNSNGYASFVLLENGKIYTKSTAALMVARKLSGGMKFMYAFMIIPTSVRDFFYNIIARNRYKWFGKKSTCWLPGTQRTIK